MYKWTANGIAGGQGDVLKPGWQHGMREAFGGCDEIIVERKLQQARDKTKTGEQGGRTTG